MSDNGKDLNKEQPQVEDPNDKVLVLAIYVRKSNNRIEVNGLLDQKKLCFNAIAEAIKCVANFEPSRIVKPTGNRIINFMRNKGRR